MPEEAAIAAMNLKQGKTILCGPTDKQLGAVSFETSCSDKVRKDFNLALALLHSFEYDESEKAFAAIIRKEPTCAMAYWGIAMSNFHPLWAPPGKEEFEKGRKAVSIAQSLPKSIREAAYINAIAEFYKDPGKTTHRDRCINFEKAMERLHLTYPDDKDAAALYALALDGAADPADKNYTKQKKAGYILNSLWASQPNHPGVIHYIIHSYDYPALAAMALPAAKKYAAVAPSSAHAQHMPSHIFVRLGLWDESIRSNIIAASAAKCYAEGAGIKGHWDEELHSMDYLVYSYLQKGDNKHAKEQWDYLKTIREVYPVGPKVVYSFAAIPSRYLFENRMWSEAVTLQPQTIAGVTWEKYPWEKAIIHFTRLLSAIHLNQPDIAHAEFIILNQLHDTLVQKQDVYKANQVLVQVKASAAWMLFKEGKNEEALQRMNEAVAIEDITPKPPVTPGEVGPAIELLGDLLMAMNKPAEALNAYEINLRDHPKRFNGLYGAGLAAERAGNIAKAGTYYQQLLTSCNTPWADRPELAAAEAFLKTKYTLSVNY
ncbi:tetratricopeptide repeat protein [Chitinophaga sp. CF418]|uniref:tetratricopeptide repeat protein n=1 Tax=Chitinophaga sp. CF418 TaxID=1855287 RepID=UPI0009192202|nr:tetratricopeptide repeat protein [Chitinophaga sp. CF418]SHN33726.1 Tetratricopeptide repeat-containing protein [Chitinophaga sp. CF418]